MTQWTGANFCWLSETCNPAVCGCEMLLNVWKNAKYVWQLNYSSRWIIPWGSASTRAKMGMCSSSQSLFTISLLFTSGTPLPWFTQTQWLSKQITKTALSERRQHSDQKQTQKNTVIMMQGESFVQKSSSSSLWNVASFSMIMTNFADDTISEKGQGQQLQW